jgi:hypothetical protein
MTYFHEEQRFAGWVFALVAAIAIVSAIIPLCILLFFERVQNSSGAWAFVIGPLISIGVLVLFRMARLVTEVRSEGLFIRFVPFHRSERKIDVESATNVTAITYNPIADYGGWGIRMSRTGKAYNVSGNRGVLITQPSGKTLLVGSAEADTLAAALLEYRKELQ